MATLTRSPLTPEIWTWARKNGYTLLAQQKPEFVAFLFYSSLYKV